ncbi:S-layer domain protein [Paenibacillus curdlanolyticus YK9]|uniref:S-layer domain protein n=1 Tax=Paenibacillus curdlanolyticus YK9 TaxID=717606 RepID=E0IA63_9BACL|nr:S-layer homology domain-containing protein [Paenibacillus curdlanolyticus]EFM10640.1 S-layer domain protein [Paenibacillus curdlanolyticus YK9]
MKKFRSILSALLAVSLVFGTLLASVSAASSENVDKHWAAGTLKKWLDAGLIQGYPDGTVKPDAPVTRGEFAALLNRAFGLKDEAASVSFNDLPTTNWAYHEIAVAVKAGYLQGTGGGKVSPAQAAARQEASVMVANVLHLDTKTNTDVSQFKDAAQIADWSKGAIAALASKQIVKGDEQGNFRPKASITRAEAVVVLDAALELQNNSATKTFDKAGVYGSADKTETIDGNVVISAAGVTLQNMVITGNLTIAKEVAEGDVTLKNVTVKGTTTVNGGGPNSIHLEDSVLLRIIVDKATGRVRLVAIGATTVQDVIIQSPVKIEESHVTDSGFKNIELSKALPKDSNVELVGHFESVGVMAANIQLNIPSGTVDNLDVASGAAGNTINVSKEAQVLKLILDAVAKLIGEGKVDQATVNDAAKGSSFETKPGQVDGSAKDSITTPGTAVVIGGGGGSTGGNNSGSDTGGNNGGNTGGDNGGNNGGSTPPQCTVDCDDATLHSLSVTGSVYMELVQRDFGVAKVGIGFESNMQDYSVDLAQNFTESDVNFTVTAAAYAKLSYSLVYDDGNEIKDIAVGDQGTFNIHLREKHDATVMVTVTNANDNQSWNYYVKFVYQRDLQEAFRIFKLPVSPTETYQFFETSALEEGDHVVVTVPAADTTKGLKISVNFDCGKYGSGYNLADYSKNNFFKPVNTIGKLHVVVTRAGQEIMNGEYQYDLTPVPLITDGTGINASLWTQEQMKQDGAENASYRIEIDLDKNANPALQNVKYMDVMYEDKVYTNMEKRVWTYEDFKTSQNKYGFTGPTRVGNNSYLLTSYGYNEVHDKFAYIFLFDEHKKLIGCYVQELHFDADHVGEGVTIVPPVVK